METIKIQISEVEGLTIKIPTEFTADSFNKFYKQMLLISKIVPSSQLLISKNEQEDTKVKKTIYRIPNYCPDRLKIGNWGDKQECLDILKAWGMDKRRGAIAWIKRYKGWELDNKEISKVSQLIGSIRAKYKKELEL